MSEKQDNFFEVPPIQYSQTPLSGASSHRLIENELNLQRRIAIEGFSTPQLRLGYSKIILKKR
jgi:hypothetical protein